MVRFAPPSDSGSASRSPSPSPPASPIASSSRAPPHLSAPPLSAPVLRRGADSSSSPTKLRARFSSPTPPPQPRRARGSTPYWLRSPGDTSLSSPPSSSASSLSDPDDSEEELYPVSIRRRAISRRQSAAALSASAAEAAHRIRLASCSSPDYAASLLSSASRSSWATDAARRISRSRSRTAAAQQRSTPAPGPRAGAPELDDVVQLLQQMRMRSEQQDRRDREAFERRNKDLWDRINTAIRENEKQLEEKRAAEAAALAASRRAQEEAEKVARAAREAEEAKIKREKEEAAKAEKAQAEEKERLAKQEKARLEEEERAKGQGRLVGPGLRATAREEYAGWTSKMQRIKTEVLPVVSGNAEWRKQCFAAKRQITPKIGQLTNSRSEIARITTAICGVLDAARSTGVAQIYTWILNHLSKCLIRQAEQEVAAKQDTAWPLARVALWIMLEGHGEFGEVLMCRLVKKCCWCIGFVPDRSSSQDEAAYGKQIGRSKPDEASLQFTARMCGILAFYTGICVLQPTPPPSGCAVDLARVPVHMRPAALWTWQARCATPPMTDHGLTPALWATFLEVAGPRTLDIYGRQAAKLWRLLLQQGLEAKKAKFAGEASANAATMRLRLLLEGWAQSGRIVDATGGTEMDA